MKHGFKQPYVGLPNILLGEYVVPEFLQEDATPENLAQAVLVVAYELWMEAEGRDQPFKPPRRDAPPAPVQLLERMFEETERALWAVDFFKARQTDSVMRSLRGIAHRADLDEREAGFLRAIAVEVQKYIARVSPRRREEEDDG